MEVASDAISKSLQLEFISDECVCTTQFDVAVPSRSHYSVGQGAKRGMTMVQHSHCGVQRGAQLYHLVLAAVFSKVQSAV